MEDSNFRDYDWYNRREKAKFQIVYYLKYELNNKKRGTVKVYDLTFLNHTLNNVNSSILGNVIYVDHINKIWEHISTNDIMVNIIKFYEHENIMGILEINNKHSPHAMISAIRTVCNELSKDNIVDLDALKRKKTYEELEKENDKIFRKIKWLTREYDKLSNENFALRAENEKMLSINNKFAKEFERVQYGGNLINKENYPSESLNIDHERQNFIFINPNNISQQENGFEEIV